MTDFPDWPYTLYRLYGEDRDLLYVGISGSVLRRIKEHRQVASWWDQVVLIETEEFKNQIAARGAEMRAIRAENPRYNVARDWERHKAIRHPPLPPIVARTREDA